MIVGRRRRSGRWALVCAVSVVLVAALLSRSPDRTFTTVAKPLPAVTNSVLPTISGTPHAGATVTAVPGTWAPAGVVFSYRWRVGTTTKNLATVLGATAATYIPKASDVGKRLAVDVTGSATGYSSTLKTSALSDVVTADTGIVGATPTITGTTKVDATLGVTPGTWSPVGVALAYQWLSGTTVADSLPVAGATATSYVPRAVDVGRKISVRVTGSKAGYTDVVMTSTLTASIASATLTSTPAPQITGTAKVDSTLTATPGTWTPAPVTFSYQWLSGTTVADSLPVAGATGTTFVPRATDVGKRLSVRVTGSKAGYTTVTTLSALSAAVLPGNLTPAPIPTIDGSPAVDGTLSAETGTWSTSGVDFAYQWLVGSTVADSVPIPGATAATYSPAVSDLGQKLSVRVTGTKTGYAPETVTSALSGAVAPGSLTTTPIPTISGTPAVDQTLTAIPGTWTPSGVTFGYQWFAGTTAADSLPISGATGTTYLPATADVGKRISVRVTGSKTAYSPATVASALTGQVLAAPAIVPGTPVISGQPVIGSTLTADPGAWSPDGVSFSYQWLLDGGAIAGATGTSYVPVVGDLGGAVSVRVTGTKSGLPPASGTSAPLPPVAEGALPPPPTPTITGTTEIGDTLTIVPGSWGAGVTLTYQWLRGGVPIDGETAVTHVVTADDNHTVISARVFGSQTGFVGVSSTSAGITVEQSRQSSAKVDRALQAYHAALATAGSSPVDVFVGPSDSIAEGYGATSVNKRWISILRDDLRRDFQPAGVAGGAGYMDLWNQGFFSDYPVKATSAIQNWSYGLGDESLDFPTTSQTATITETFTAMDILYAGSTNGSTGILRYTVDGGPDVLVNTGNSSATRGGFVTSITGLAPGVHTVKITGGVTSVAPTVEGVMIYNGDTTKGIRLWEGARSGFTAALYVGAYRGWEDSLPNIHPDLVVLPLGSNDYYVGRTAAQTKVYLLRIISEMRAKFGSSPSIVLMPYYDRSNSSTETWADYVDMYYSIAAADPDICVFDLTPLFGPWVGDDRGGLTIGQDLVHPSNTGHKLIGDSLAAFLAP